MVAVSTCLRLKPFPGPRLRWIDGVHPDRSSVAGPKWPARNAPSEAALGACLGPLCIR
jgi:hypothetical protein